MMPGANPFPTAAPGAVETIVAGTAGAAQTQTAVLIPATPTATSTPTVTRTATVTPTMTPTFLWLWKTATPRVAATLTPTDEPPGGEFSCRLIDQDPEDGSKLSKNTDFDAVWEVRNTGTRTWDAGSVDFIYISGRKMHEEAAYDLPRKVNPDATIDLIVDMTTPKTAGTYKVEWALRRGDTEFCFVNMSIVVK